MDVLDKMATYVRVYEAGSLSAAARQLRISAAAVSRQIATLERELGVSLLLRTTRRMVATDAGRAYYDRCVRILRDVEDAQSVGRASAPLGLLRVSAPVTFGLAFVVPHLASLLRDHPGLTIDLRVEDRLVDLSIDGVDVAIRASALPPDSTDLVAHPLIDLHRVLVASPAYLRRRGTPKTPEALAQHDVLDRRVGGDGETWTLQRGTEEVRVATHVRFRSNALHALHELARQGVGITVATEEVVADDLASGRLRRVLPEWRGQPARVHAIHRTTLRGAPRVRALVEHLRAAYARKMS